MLKRSRSNISTSSGYKSFPEIISRFVPRRIWNLERTAGCQRVAVCTSSMVIMVEKKRQKVKRKAYHEHNRRFKKDASREGKKKPRQQAQQPREISSHQTNSP